MPVLQATTVVPPNTIGDWVVTDENTNIVVGVKGSEYEIDYHIGDPAMVYPADRPAGGATLISKAHSIRIRNKGRKNLSFGVFV